MGANHGEGASGLPMIAIEAVASRGEQPRDRLEAVSVRHLTAQRAPEQCNRVEPGTGGGSRQHHQSPGR